MGDYDVGNFNITATTTATHVSPAYNVPSESANIRSTRVSCRAIISGLGFRHLNKRGDLLRRDETVGRGVLGKLGRPFSQLFFQLYVKEGRMVVEAKRGEDGGGKKMNGSIH